MQYTTLGNTGLRVSVAGLGTGGFSRIGLKSGKTEDEAARLILEAVGLGVNFIDTAPPYGTEGVVGRALKSMPRDQVVVATKAFIHRNNEWSSPERVVASLDNSLRLIGTDYVDVFNLHGIEPDEYDYALQHDRAGAGRAEGEGQDPAYRPHREPDRRFHQRDAQARGARSGLGGVHGGLPHDAPGRAGERVSGSRAKRASARS